MHIFVGNLALTTTDQELRPCFEASGAVESVRLTAIPAEPPGPVLIG